MTGSSFASSSQPLTAEALLSFANEMNEKIQTLDVISSEDTVVLLKQLDTINLKSIPSPEQLRQLDSLAVKLWNLTLHKPRKLMCLVQALCAQVLIVCQNAQVGYSTNLSRLNKTILKAVKACLDNDHTAISRKLIEHYEPESQAGSSHATGQQAGSIFNAPAHYLLQRFHLAFKERKTAEAVMWFDKVKDTVNNLDKPTIEELITTIMETVKTGLSTMSSHDLCKWLIKTDTIFGEAAVKENTDLVSRARLRLLQFCIKIPTAAMSEGCRALLNQLFSDLGKSKANDRLFLLTELEFCARPDNLKTATKVPESTVLVQLDRALRQFARQAVLTQTSFDTILHYIGKQSRIAPNNAISMMKEVLLPRLKEHGEQDWIEKSITMLLLSRNQVDKTSPVRPPDDFIDIFDECYKLLRQPMSTVSAHACLMAISLSLQLASQKDDQLTIETWCNLGLHPLLVNIEDENKAKLQRKLMLHYLGLGLPQKVRELYDSMSGAARNSPDTQFILFKANLWHGSASLIKDSLESILVGAQQDRELVYACIQEAQNRNRISLLSEILMTVLLSKNNQHIAATPALFRLALKHIKTVEDGKPILTNLMQAEYTCALYERASIHLHDTNSEITKLWTLEELEWFSTSAWNLTLQYMSDWRSDKVSVLISASVKFLKRLTRDSPTSSAIIKRYLIATYLDCAFTTIRMRQAKTLHDLRAMCDAVAERAVEYSDVHQKYENALEKQDGQEIDQKSLAITAFMFEAAMKVQDWHKALQTLQHTGRAEGRYLNFENQAMLADIVLHTNMPLSEKFEMLEIIINNCFTVHPDVEKLSRWLRCVVSLSIETQPAQAMGLLHKALALASQQPDKYPDEELRWLSIHTFNRAIDFYADGNIDLWKEWTTMSQRLALTLGDGNLHKVLGQNMAEMQVT